jgi:hypothetical protein
VDADGAEGREEEKEERALGVPRILASCAGEPPYMSRKREGSAGGTEVVEASAARSRAVRNFIRSEGDAPNISEKLIVGSLGAPAPAAPGAGVLYGVGPPTAAPVPIGVVVAAAASRIRASCIGEAVIISWGLGFKAQGLGLRL